MKKTYLFSLICLLSIHLMAQENSETKNPYSLKVSGFVKAEAIFDTRQVVEARDGYFLFYPKAPELDLNGEDINAHGSFNQYAMSSRLKFLATGPDVLNAKISAVIEADFTGASNAENNSLRLRHAYLKLNWAKASVLAGQYWHPFNISEMIPYVASLNTGAPFHSFCRQPQIRFDYRPIEKLNFVLAAVSQRDNSNTGVSGSSTDYLKNSMIPNLDAQIQYTTETFFCGAAIDYKRLIPRLKTLDTLVADERLDCFAGSVFAMLKTKPLICRAQVIYGQGLNDQSLMGAYGVTSIDPETDARKYANLNYASAWINLQTTGKRWQYSIFGGYTQGFGAKDEIVDNTLVYGRDPKIAYIWRVAPMVTFIQGKFNFTGEIEHTVAAYGTPDKKFVVKDAEDVANTRFTLTAIYFF